MTDWISTKNAMQLLGVGSTTIKRWANEGTLPSRRTAGGHRRFRRDAVERLLQKRPPKGNDPAIDDWIALLTEDSNIMEIRDEIVQLRDRLGDWYRAADFLDNVMREIRIRYQDTDDSVGWGLVSTGRLCLALSALRSSFAVEPATPSGLVVSFGGRQHSHRPPLIQLCTRSEGIELLLASTKTSIQELTAQIRSWKQSLVVLCQADHCTDCDLLMEAYGDISAACQERDVTLIVGFAAIRGDFGGYEHYCRSFEDFRNVLQGL